MREKDRKCPWLPDVWVICSPYACSCIETLAQSPLKLAQALLVILDVEVSLRNLERSSDAYQGFSLLFGNQPPTGCPTLSLGGGCQSTDKKFRKGLHSDSFPSLSASRWVGSSMWHITKLRAKTSHFDILTIAVWSIRIRHRESKPRPFRQFP